MQWTEPRGPRESLQPRMSRARWSQSGNYDPWRPVENGPEGEKGIGSRWWVVMVEASRRSYYYS